MRNGFDARQICIMSSYLCSRSFCPGLFMIIFHHDVHACNHIDCIFPTNTLTFSAQNLTI